MPGFAPYPMMFAALCCLCGLILTASLFASHLHARHVPGVRQWVVGSGALSLGLGATSLQSLFDSPWLVVAGSTLLIIGHGLVWLGARQHRRAEDRRGARGGFTDQGAERFFLGGVLLFVGVFVWVVVAMPTPLLRYLLYSSMAAMWCALALLEFVGTALPGTLWARRGAALAVGLLCAMYVARLITILVAQTPASLVTPEPINAVTLLSGGVLMLMLLLCLNVLVVATLVFELRANSRTDHLTGISNRQGFLSDAPYWLTSMAGQRVFALRIEICDLKRVNDIAGHSQGDEMLRVAAHTAESLLPSSAMLARWGGAELMVFVAGVAVAKKFEIEYLDAFQRTASQLPAFRGLSAPARHITPTVIVRTSEHLNALNRTLGINSLPNAPGAAGAHARVG
jgi:diguanylate cyclase (GGDEF)-like protein